MILWKKMISFRMRIYGKIFIIFNFYMKDHSISTQIDLMLDYYNKSRPEELLNEETIFWIKTFGKKYRDIYEKGINDITNIKRSLYN